MISARNRDVSFRKALRKRRLAKQIAHWDYYDNLHEYSKGKIHCSCPSCSPKTRNKGRRNRRNYARALNYKASDYRKVINMDEQMEEEGANPIHHRPPTWD